MLSNHLLLKLFMTPLIIAAATLVARRWGENIGGVIVGLPLTSGPVSIFFALEQGHPFAASAAKGAMLGLIPVAMFCIGYVISSKRSSWYVSAITGISLYLITVWGMAMINPSLGWVAILVPMILSAALLMIGKAHTADHPVSSPWWDLPVRILIATSLVLIITTGAGTFGPTWSGLLSPFPIFTFVMATFSHSQSGPGAAGRLICGVLTGLFSYTAFFLVVALLVERSMLPVTYALATFTALAINAAMLALVIRKNRLGTTPKGPVLECTRGETQ